MGLAIRWKGPSSSRPSKRTAFITEIYLLEGSAASSPASIKADISATGLKKTPTEWLETGT